MSQSPLLELFSLGAAFWTFKPGKIEKVSQKKASITFSAIEAAKSAGYRQAR